MSKKKILIIDDDDDFRESTRVVLEAEGYKTFCARNKQEGLERIENVLPDLIIMDVMMEKMSDGFDLSRKLKQDDKFGKIPILMITAVGKKTGFRFSADAGDKEWLPVDDFAEKPVSPGELINKVRKLLSE